MASIDTTQALSFGSVAELVRLLHSYGVRQQHLDVALDNLGIVRSTAEVLTRATKYPKRLSIETCRALIDQLFPLRYDDEGESRSYRDDVIYHEEAEMLSTPEVVNVLLRELTQQQLQVVFMRSGLHGNPVQTAQEVGEQLCLTPAKVNRIRGRAARIMKARAFQYIERSRAGLRHYV